LTNFKSSTRTELCGSSDIFGGDRREHVTPLLRDRLHLLRARERIIFKLFISLQDDVVASNYIEDSCVPVSSVSTRVALCSAARGDLVVPRTRLRLGNRAFSVAGPATLNILPSDIRTASKLSILSKIG